jgi:flagellar biosynthesis GTPase FlhF
MRLSTKKLLDGLPVVAALAVPAAPAFFFAVRVYEQAQQQLALAGLSASWLALLAALAGALALESAGIMAGHILVSFAERRAWWHVAAAVLALGVYVAIGWYELAGTVGAAFFILAPAVYLLTAQHKQLLDVERADERKNAHSADLAAQNAQQQAERAKLEQQQAHELALMAERARLDRLAERQRAKLERQQQKASASMSDASAPVSASGNGASVASANGKAASASGDAYKALPLTAKRRSVDKAELKQSDWQWIAAHSTADVAEKYGKGLSTARKWRAEAKQMRKEASAV